MNDDEHERSLVEGLRTGTVSALSVRAAAQRVLDEQSWPARIALLVSDPSLVDKSLARWFAERGDEFLAAFVVRAVEVGLQAARAELPLALALEGASRVDTNDLDGPVILVQMGCARVDEGADWIWPLVVKVVHLLIATIRSEPGLAGIDEVGAQLAEVRAAVEPLLLRTAGATPQAVAQALSLSLTDWDEVWAALPSLTETAEIANACVPLQLVTAWFEADPRVADWVEDLQNVLTAAMQRGVEPAIDEHQLVLAAREAPLDDGVPEDQRADHCAELTDVCLDYFQSTGAGWVLDAALDAADAAYHLTNPTHPKRAERASSLGGVLAGAVRAGALESQALREAVDYKQEAYDLTDPTHADRARFASNLGSVIAEAVDAGVLQPQMLRAAVDFQREGYRLRGATDPERAVFASNLGNVLAEAVHAGVLQPQALREAVDYKQEAYDLTDATHTDRAMFASNLSGDLSQAVEAGVLEPRALHAAVDYQREAYELTGPTHPYRAIYASNLGCILADAVLAGFLEPQLLTEAVDYQREAYELTGPTHRDRARFASRLGEALADAVLAGFLEPQLLTEAVDYQREAYELTGPTHPGRGGRASGLGGSISAAVQAGVLEPQLLSEAVDYQREAYELTGPTHPHRAAYASSLGNVLSEAIRAGVLESQVRREAVDYQREAYELTGPTHPHRAGCASSLGQVLADAVWAGLLDPQVLREAVDLQREAYDLTGPTHPQRAGCASNLGGVLADAVRQGVLEPQVLREAVDYQREAYRLTDPTHMARAMFASNLGEVLADAVRAGVLEPQILNETAREMSGLLDEMWRLARRGVTLTHRRQVLATVHGMSVRMPLVLLHISDPLEAVRAIEALRGHLTGGMHAPHLRPGSVEPDLETTYRQVAVDYEATQARAREGLAGYADASPSAVHLAEVIDRIRASAPALSSFGGRPLFADLCASLPDQAAGIYLLPAPPAATPTQAQRQSGAAVIVRRDGRTSQVPLPGLIDAAALENAAALLTDAAAAQSVCAWLWDTVGRPLIDHGGPLLADASEWVFVPSRSVGLLPLHAAGTHATGWLDDHVTVRVTPSLLALTDVDARVTPSGSPILAVSGAADLTFLAADRAVTRAFIRDVSSVADPVTADSALEALTEAPVAVMCGHAVHSFRDGGALDFGAADDDATGVVRARWLTAGTVELLPLRDRQWIFLSSCSSGQTAGDLPNEAIGLPSAFRHAGFRTVIATTWPVKDHIAFITLARYLQYRQTNPQDSASIAIRRTRAWLRNATRDHLITWLDALTTTASIPSDNADSLRQWWTNCPESMPYADPQDWAPYAATGH